MRTLCIVTCGKRKIWDKFPDTGPTEARYVYIGPLAKKCMEYAERFYQTSWRILSAKYGFLLPDDVIPHNYNVSFSDPLTNPITVAELSAQVRSRGYDKCEEIIVLAGMKYSEIVREAFGGRSIFNPLSDCSGNGYMMQRLKQAIDRGVPL